MNEKRNLKVVLALLVLLAVGMVAACSPISRNTNNTASTNAASNAEPVGTPSGAGGESKLPVPENLVADLYKAHDGKKSPFFQTTDRTLVDKYFTKQLADLIWKDATTSKGEVGAIDGDPLYNAQDVSVKNFAIAKGDVKGGDATVVVSFNNYDQKQVLTYSLKAIGDAWKIDNISYGGGESLMKWLKAAYPAASKDAPAVEGEFQGKYIVGPTTCTVKPAKMAFEVRWAAGKGVEMFFADGDNAFASDPVKGDANRFVFDDENYDTGKFFRADGKVFDVKRAK